MGAGIPKHVLPSKHLNAKHSTFQTTFWPVFKWSNHLIRQTFQIPKILFYKNDIFCLVFRTPLENWTIWQSDFKITVCYAIIQCNHLTTDLYSTFNQSFLGTISLFTYCFPSKINNKLCDIDNFDKDMSKVQKPPWGHSNSKITK